MITGATPPAFHLLAKPIGPISIVVTYRLVTSYLPPVLGFFSLDWMTKKGCI